MGKQLGQIYIWGHIAALYNKQKCQDNGEEEPHTANISWQAGGEADVASR